MTVTWTSGYGIGEAIPVVEWGLQGAKRSISPAGTLTFDRGSMCGECEFFLLLCKDSCLLIHRNLCEWQNVHIQIAWIEKERGTSILGTLLDFDMIFLLQAVITHHALVTNFYNSNI